ncbi:MAG: T9SS type A sorting domain-containing protein [Bacteroidales bacterium]|nr:MAG: T9SS type A sorting domain-containing protein [Bacteroidales bacterium]
MKIKTANFLISILLCFAFAATQAIAQNIIFISPDDREAENIAFLKRQGFNVTQFWQEKDINLVGQDTIDLLNSADLLIIGRSGPSSSFQQDEERVVWNALTPPTMLICPWKSRSTRLRFFNSGSAYHEDNEPDVVYAKLADPTDPIFANADVMADSTVDWFSPPPHDFIQTFPATTTTNAEIVATYNDSSILIARWDANVRFYDETPDSAAGPRTYFGMGNDNLGWPNFFPLTKNGKAIYLAEICRMLGIAIKEPVFAPVDNEIIFISPDDREAENIAFLKRQGFNVTQFWQDKDINLVGQDTIDLLNSADLLIIGRSGPSSSFQQDEERVVWNALTPPTMLICPWKSRNTRLRFFNSGSAYHEDAAPPIAYAKVADPTDPIFADADVMADSTLDWCLPPHDFIQTFPATTTTNAEIVATYNDSSILVARWDANVRFYDETPDSAAGPRTYFGMGNDNTGWANFFPLTKNAKKVYLAEICRMLGIEAPEIKWGPSDMEITFITPDEREVPNMSFLEKNGFKVNPFWQEKDINLVGQDTIDLLNAADLLIIGRSGPSSSFQQDEERVVWNGLTAPTMLICPWKSRSSRLRYFNSTDAYHEDTEPAVAIAKAELPDDAIFSNVSLDAEDMMEWCLPPHDYIRISPTAVTTNAELVATYNDSSILVARFAPQVRFYDETPDSAEGPRSYFGMGNDNVGYPNFFPLTYDAQQVYLNEVCNMLGIDLVDAQTVSLDATLSAIEYDVASAVLDPAFDAGVTEYTLTLTEEPNTVTITGVANDAMATVDGGGLIDVSDEEAENVMLTVWAENGGRMRYTVTVEPYIAPEAIEDVTSSDIKLFPNPVNDILSIVSENPNVRITVYNTIGKVVMEHKADNNLIQLDVSNLDAGIYLIRMEDAENVVIGKFSKE